ncbi:MAG: DUF1343 domain-containing protein, partial [Gemmatimonadetes bacterium]|nr:DUF1343 domain-containing protein [Gemmatimonadota bacterium]NIQ53898.1 DUF1343 domain-containing protein [Gemmatimonadota bacterium]NIU74067.1 DUF1343 domain-containing protein [Gammaproteobacteria bacterium]NIX44123.1 DUF1343 domain-containing protein [Gemmatimonadota bacterium]NIY08360.1 DUF1343 domain-containing protein [Gemmatimonadota bacterium]
MTRSGIDVLIEERTAELRGARLGVIAHPASVTRELRSTVDAILEHPDLDLAAVFGPQHGVHGEKQDNM